MKIGGLWLWVWVIMPDHVHMIVSPGGESRSAIAFG